MNYIEDAINLITSNPLYLVISVAIVVMIAISLMKKLIKLFIITLLVAIAYGGYLLYTGADHNSTSGDIKEKLLESKEKLKEAGDKLKQKGKELLEKNKPS